MSKRQKFELECAFLDGLTFDEARDYMGFLTSDQEDDARFTWRRWCREQDMWGFFAFGD